MADRVLQLEISEIDARLQHGSWQSLPTEEAFE